MVDRESRLHLRAAGRRSGSRHRRRNQGRPPHHPSDDVPSARRGVGQSSSSCTWSSFLVIEDQATLTESASPIADLFAQQVSPWFSKLVIALALTNILVCVLAIMLVATRLVYALGRDNMLPVPTASPGVASAQGADTSAVWATGLVSRLALLLSALANEQTFSYIVGMSALGFFCVYLLTTGGLLVANARKRFLRGSWES